MKIILIIILSFNDNLINFYTTFFNKVPNEFLAETWSQYLPREHGVQLLENWILAISQCTSLCRTWRLVIILFLCGGVCIFCLIFFRIWLEILRSSNIWRWGTGFKLPVITAVSLHFIMALKGPTGNYCTIHFPFRI